VRGSRVGADGVVATVDADLRLRLWHVRTQQQLLAADLDDGHGTAAARSVGARCRLAFAPTADEAYGALGRAVNRTMGQDVGSFWEGCKVGCWFWPVDSGARLLVYVPADGKGQQSGDDAASVAAFTFATDGCGCGTCVSMVVEATC